MCSAESMLLKPTSLESLKKVLPHAIGGLYEGLTEIKVTQSLCIWYVLVSVYYCNFIECIILVKVDEFLRDVDVLMLVVYTNISCFWEG